MQRKDFQKCKICNKGVMHSGNVTFYRVTIEHHVADTKAIRQLHGLEMIVGSPDLAGVFAPQKKLSSAASTKIVLICQSCIIKKIHLAKLI